MLHLIQFKGGLLPERIRKSIGWSLSGLLSVLTKPL